MFLCPLTSTKLRSAFVRGVNIWYSPESGGRLINLAAIRKILGEDVASELWVRSGLRDTEKSWKKCPSCSHHLRIVNAPRWAGSYEVDVCRNCHIVWLDSSDFPQVPVPEDMISPHGDASLVRSIAQDIATGYVAQDKKDNPDILGEGPEAMWKIIPAVMGMPVEMDDARKNGLGWLTWSLAAVMLLIHYFFTSVHLEFLREWALIPTDLFRHLGLTTVTWGFIHADWGHLISNLYFFGVFADDVEVYYGKKKFLLLIVSCLIFSAFGMMIFQYRSNIPHVGISGVICALMVNYGLIYRKSRIAFFLPYMHSFSTGRFTRVFGWVRIASIWVVLGYFLKDFVLYFVFELTSLTHVSYSGHVLGSIFGFLFWLLNGCPNWYYDSVSVQTGTVKERMLLPYE